MNIHMIVKYAVDDFFVTSNCQLVIVAAVWIKTKDTKPAKIKVRLLKRSMIKAPSSVKTKYVAVIPKLIPSCT